MQFIASLLRIDLTSSGPSDCFLMLTQLPDHGKLDLREIVEGAFMRYSSDNALIDDFKQAGLSEGDIGLLTSALALNKSLTRLGVLTLDSKQLRALGFQTLAKVAGVLGINSARPEKSARRS